MSSTYFHLSPAAIERQLKYRTEAAEAPYRSAMARNIAKALAGLDPTRSRVIAFEKKRGELRNITELRDWLGEQLHGLSEELSPDEMQTLNRDIREMATENEKLFPYGRGFAEFFVRELKKERLDTVAEFLRFTCEPWYADTAGFYMLNRADDTSYLLDIITEHLHNKPDEASPVTLRAIDWLTAQIGALPATEPTAPQPLDTPAAPDSPLVLDTLHHFPGVLGPFVGVDEPLALRQWGTHLAGRWAAPRQHSAPSDYDLAYYNQTGGTRAEFLAALRRVHDAVWLALSAPHAEHTLFDGTSVRPDGATEPITGTRLLTLATRGAAWLNSWLNWRALPPAEQLLTALGTVQISNATLRLHTNEPECPPLLIVPDCAPQVEAERFRLLLKDFQRHLPHKKTALRALLARLAPLRALPLDTLRDGPARELPTRFPAIEWPELRDRPAESGEAESLWPDLAQALQTRAEWAARAYDVVALALGRPIAVTHPSPPTPETPAAPPHPGSLALNIATPDAATVWASLLCKNVAYTLDDLDGLLVSLGLLIDAASRNPTPDFKGSAVLGAIKALRERRYLRATNNAKLARLLAERYGTDAANPHTVKRGTDRLPEPANPIYTLALALLPAP